MMAPEPASEEFESGVTEVQHAPDAQAEGTGGTAEPAAASGGDGVDEQTREREHAG